MRRYVCGAWRKRLRITLWGDDYVKNPRHSHRGSDSPADFQHGSDGDHPGSYGLSQSKGETPKGWNYKFAATTRRLRRQYRKDDRRKNPQAPHDLGRWQVGECHTPRRVHEDIAGPGLWTGRR